MIPLPVCDTYIWCSAVSNRSKENNSTRKSACKFGNIKEALSLATKCLKFKKVDASSCGCPPKAPSIVRYYCCSAIILVGNTSSQGPKQGSAITYVYMMCAFACAQNDISSLSPIYGFLYIGGPVVYACMYTLCLCFLGAYYVRVRSVRLNTVCAHTTVVLGHMFGLRESV